MREHEVPTHVQAEDRVLLWFTFPQIVAITAVCAVSYGAYRYAPVGPSGVRMTLAVVLGLAGIAVVVGQIGGRRLPLVIADLLRFWLGPRVYAGTPAQLLRSEPPAPPPASPGPLTLLARRAQAPSSQAAQGPGTAERTQTPFAAGPYRKVGRIEEETEGRRQEKGGAREQAR